jgi:hypothetical protein
MFRCHQVAGSRGSVREEIGMSDDQQRGEELDEMLPDEFPPDDPLGVDELGTTPVEELGGESVADRDRRTLPERGAGAAGEAERAGPPVAEGVRPTDSDDGVFLPVDEERPDDLDEAGVLAEDDQVSGDETARDVATERTSQPAEEAAIHVEHE